VEETMSDGVNNHLSRDAVAPSSKAEPSDRWPLLYSVMLIVGLSGALWVLIIAGVRWLIP
jgi:hypothetical protein